MVLLFCMLHCFTGLKFRIKRYFPLVDEEILLVAARGGSVVVGVVLVVYPSRVNHII